jgi:predicted nucleic acid-binding protein
MILVDTGALYALIDRNDMNHTSAKKFYRSLAGSEVFAISLPILTEAWILIDASLGSYFANRLWQSILEGMFEILEMDNRDLKSAVEIEIKYKDSDFGFVDSTCFALCEKHRIRRVFTYDRTHFGIFQPSFSEYLELLPAQ